MATTSAPPSERAEATGAETGRGRDARAPVDVPVRGWRDILTRTLAEAKADGVSLLAAGVAFYGMLALVPALTAFAGIYGLVADPAEAGSSVDDLLGAAPSEVRELVTAQLREIADRPERQAGVAAVVGIALALWSASTGMRHLIGALNLAYDEEEGRGFVRLRAISLLLTLGATAFVIVSIVVIAVLPAALADTSVGDPARTALGILRWPLLGIAMALGLAVLYRHGPDRDQPRWEWAGIGSLVATVVWLAGSGLFSLYTANFARYGETYGSLGAIVVAMLWFLLTAAAVLLGAELNAESERQTAEDTTVGRDRPLGQRGAHAADTIGPAADEVEVRSAR